MIKKQYSAIAILCLIFFIANLIFSFYEGAAIKSVWYCSISLILIALGILLGRKILIDTIYVATFGLNVLWLIDFLSFIFTGNLILGIGVYLYELNSTRLFITLYHLLVLIAPLYIIIREGKFNTNSWVYASIFLLAIFDTSLLLSALTTHSINCISSECTVGLFDFIYKIKPSFVPYFIFHWIMATLILFIPTSYLTNHFLKKTKK